MKLYEFKDHEQFIKTAIGLHQKDNLQGVYSPLPEEEIVEAIGLETPWPARAAVIGALVGLIGGFALQYITNVWHYPLNIAGRPLNSWPAFLVVTFELGVLCSAFSLVGCFILGNRFPRFDREVFGVKAYNDCRHIHYFILTKKEDKDVEAFDCHDIPDSH